MTWPLYNERRSFCLMGLPRMRLRTLVAILTGHRPVMSDKPVMSVKVIFRRGPYMEGRVNYGLFLKNGRNAFKAVMLDFMQLSDKFKAAKR
ncbi:hypothetical protein FF38_05409 [Lucilia cuprina]|uniref:Uncharacterized protein n=1 Tax=Lucilia cuprina TaxID=7375 RepID=A0A0L0C329_LUCCU|nr:hypothetical protein FF38_05409 [Lucilia cuprina]